MALTAQVDTLGKIKLPNNENIVDYTINNDGSYELISAEKYPYRNITIRKFDKVSNETQNKNATLVPTEFKKYAIEYIGRISGKWMFISEKKVNSTHSLDLISIDEKGNIRKEPFFETTEKPVQQLGKLYFYVEGSFLVSVSPDESKIAVSFLRKEIMHVFVLTSQLEVLRTEKVKINGDASSTIGKTVIDNKGNVAVLYRYNYRSDFADVIYFSDRSFAIHNLYSKDSEVTEEMLFIGDSGIQCLYITLGKRDQKTLTLCSFTSSAKKDLDKKDVSYLTKKYDFKSYTYSPAGSIIFGTYSFLGTTKMWYFDMLACVIKDSKITIAQEIKKSSIEYGDCFSFYYENEFHFLFNSTPGASRTLSGFSGNFYPFVNKISPTDSSQTPLEIDTAKRLPAPKALHIKALKFINNQLYYLEPVNGEFSLLKFNYPK